MRFPRCLSAACFLKLRYTNSSLVQKIRQTSWTTGCAGYYPVPLPTLLLRWIVPAL
jgi:hypothetical protein